MGTQTRAAFLGLIVASFVALVQGVRQGNLFGRNQLSMTKGVLVIVLVIGLVAWPAKELLHARIAADNTSFHALITGNLEELPFSSVGIRVHSWVEAMKWIAERPVTGWGQKARSDVIRLSESFPDYIDGVTKAEFGHLHNGYLEILLGFGVIGFVFLCVHWAVLLKRINLAASKELHAFALYGSIFFLILNIFESFFIYWSGEFALALIMAGGYSQYLARSLDSGPSNRASPEPQSQ